MWLTIHIADQVARRVVEHVVKVVMGTLGESKLGIVSGCGRQNSICCHPKGMEDHMARKIILSCFVDILGSQGFDQIATLEMKMVRLWLQSSYISSSPSISSSPPPFPPPPTLPSEHLSPFFQTSIPHTWHCSHQRGECHVNITIYGHYHIWSFMTLQGPFWRELLHEISHTSQEAKWTM